MASRTVKHKEYLSVKITRFYMKILGVWYTEDRREQMFMYVALSYSILSIAFGIIVELVDLYHCLGDFFAMIYNLCTTLSILIVVSKLTCFVIKYHTLTDLIAFTDKHFWRAECDELDNEVMRKSEIMSVRLIILMAIATHVTCLIYIITPIFESQGRNATDQVLPFKVWMESATVTPYYEMFYTLQSLSTIHVGLCFFCFDSTICIMTIYLVGQFEILQRRLESICDEYVDEVVGEKNVKAQQISCGIYDKFKQCIKRHTMLTSYIQRFEDVFTYILLIQVTMSSIYICVCGFLLTLDTISTLRRFIFLGHLGGSTLQLFIYTWTFNEVIIQSTEIAESAYRMKWYYLPDEGAGKLVKDGLMILMSKARRPCYMTAGKFFPVSIDIFKAVLSTTFSYFTLLRQLSKEA